MKSVHHDSANGAMALDGITLGDSDLYASGWLLPYNNRSVSGFEVLVDGHSAPATWKPCDSHAPGSERAKFELRSDFPAERRRNSSGMIRATLNDGSQSLAMFPIASDLPIPDERMAGMVGGQFREAGFSILGLLVEFSGLGQDQVVFDAGCGCGRITYGIAHYLSPKGNYIGFDTMKEHIEWARDVLARDLPQFKFIYADIISQQYNPTGTIKSTDYIFPANDGSVDLCIAISIYTHLFEDDFRHYINETTRILKSGGRSFMTAFVMTDEAKRSVASGFALQDIRHPLNQEGIFTARPDLPEAVIGIDEKMLFDWIADTGLEVEAFYPGWWANKNSPTYQDILVLRKN